ncbi:GNAT family N-acetyltransferase, partial [Streptococcus suis]
RPDDFETICQIESANFSASEAASSQAMRERIEHLADTFLVAEIEGEIAGYVVGAVTFDKYLDDALFEPVTKNSAQGGFIAVMSLSVSKDYKKQGIGTALLAALKDVAVA